jgi:uncharacterized membrane protein YidH (DUF202 family)
VDPEGSARVRDLLASNRTLLAWLRTAVAFDGMGFAVARFRSGGAPDLAAGLLGIARAAIAVLMTLAGWWPASAAALSGAVAGVLLIGYLAATAL